MGNKSVKKTNELLTDQGQRNQGYQSDLAKYGQEDRAYTNDSRAFLDKSYRDLYSSFDSDGGGGGGGGGGFNFTPLNTVNIDWSDPRANEYAKDYRNFADTGGYSDADKAIFRSRGNAVLPSFYSGLKDNLTTARNASGGTNVGYNAQSAKLARDAAFAAQDAALGVESDLANKIFEGKKFGVTGGSGLDESKISREVEVEKARNAETLRRNAEINANIQQQNAAAAAAANARARASEDSFKNKMAVLDRVGNLRQQSGSELDYYKAADAFGDSATQNFGSRQKEQGFWDVAAPIVGQVGGAALGAFTGGGFTTPKKPKASDVGGYEPWF